MTPGSNTPSDGRADVAAAIEAAAGKLADDGAAAANLTREDAAADEDLVDRAVWVDVVVFEGVSVEHCGATAATPGGAIGAAEVDDHDVRPSTTSRVTLPRRTARPMPVRKRIATALAGVASLGVVCVPVVATATANGIDAGSDNGSFAALVLDPQTLAPVQASPQPIPNEGVTFRVDSGNAVSTDVADAYSAGVVQWPLAAKDANVTDGFGPRQSPCGGCSSNHRGVDFGGSMGTPVGAIADGTVISASYGDDGGLGVHVVIEHTIDGLTVQSIYGHLDHGSITVRVGDMVRVGDRIGSLGNTGASTGPHLHLEIRVGGTHIDPLSFLFRYADGRDIEITDRPSLPWNAPQPGDEGEGWTPEQTITTPPPSELPSADATETSAPGPVESPGDKTTPSVPTQPGDTAPIPSTDTTPPGSTAPVESTPASTTAPASTEPAA